MYTHILPALLTMSLATACSGSEPSAPVVPGPQAGPQPTVEPAEKPAEKPDDGLADAADAADVADAADAAVPSEGGAEQPAQPPAFARVDPAGFTLGDDEGVALAGEVLCTLDPTPVGTLRIDVLLPPNPDKPQPTLLHVETLEGPGPFSFRVPKELGTVALMAYFDEDMNGPGPAEYGATPTAPVVVATSDISGVQFDITTTIEDWSGQDDKSVDR